MASPTSSNVECKMFYNSKNAFTFTFGWLQVRTWDVFCLLNLLINLRLYSSDLQHIPNLAVLKTSLEEMSNSLRLEASEDGPLHSEDVYYDQTDAVDDQKQDESVVGIRLNERYNRV